MKYLVSLCASVLTAFVLLYFLPVRGEEAIYEDTVRLHVIAASDSEEDQAIKLKVRDSVLALVSEKLQNITDAEEALAVVEGSKGEIKCAAQETLASLGVEDEVRVELSDEDYPIRYYDGFTLPSGKYHSLRVTLGEGEGHNWWCILFPALCAPDAVSTRDEYVEAGFTPEQYEMIRNGSPGRYKVRFRVLEILSDIFGFDY